MKNTKLIISLAAPKNETCPLCMNAEPAITTNFSPRNKHGRSSNKSTSSEKPDDTALAPLTETHKKKLKRIQKLAPSSLNESLSFLDMEIMIDNEHTSKKRSSSVKYSPCSLQNQKPLLLGFFCSKC